MHQDSKLFISPEELALLNNTEFFNIKQSVTRKIYALLEVFAQDIQSLPLHRQFPFPKGCDTNSPKISKGENFKGFPYIILDYPRLFTKDDVFAFRTMMWWGHYFSFTLHLSGKSKEKFGDAFNRNVSFLLDQGISFSIDESEWNHDMTGEGYITLQASNKDLIAEKSARQNYIKITSKMELNEWENLPTKGLTVYSSFLQSLQ